MTGIKIWSEMPPFGTLTAHFRCLAYDTPISDLEVSNYEMWTWIRCVWLERHLIYSIGAPGSGLGTVDCNTAMSVN